ncbi:hypothetical protein ACVW1C_007139 [Bradyrhizobium sp. USDA 4011]
MHLSPLMRRQPLTPTLARERTSLVVALQLDFMMI